MLKFVLIVPLLVSLVLAYAFLNEDGSIVEIEYVSQSEVKSLLYVEVILGDDKVTLTDIAQNTTESVRLYHDEMVQMSFSLVVYRSQDFSKITDEYFSQELFTEFANIRIKAVIDDQGKIVSTSFCKLPCSFD